MKKQTFFLKTILTVILAFTSLKLSAQDTAKAYEYGLFKFAPLMLFEPDGGLQLGFETKTGNRTTLQVEGAYLGISAISLFDLEQDNEWGYAIKPEVRYYPGNSAYRAEGFYLAAQGIYKYMHYENHGMTENVVNKEVVKLNGKIGCQTVSDGGFVFDMYMGVGVRSVAISSPTLEADLEKLWVGANDIGLGKVTPNLCMGFKLGFVL